MSEERIADRSFPLYDRTEKTCLGIPMFYCVHQFASLFSLTSVSVHFPRVVAVFDSILFIKNNNMDINVYVCSVRRSGSCRRIWYTGLYVVYDDEDDDGSV